MITSGSLIIKTIIALACLRCVGWQFSVCLEKYLSNPISTSISFGKLEDKIDITLTFCYKGFGTNHGTGFHNFYEVNISSNVFLGRRTKSFIQSLDVWQKESSKWQVIWNESSVNDAEIFATFVQPYPDLSYCNSWTIPRRVSKFRINEATTENIFIYVYGPDMFTSTGMRAALKAEKGNGIYIYNLGLEFTESLSTETNYCETDRQMYPDNLKAATLVKMLFNHGVCVTPYVKNQNCTCLSKENATKSLKKANNFNDMHYHVILSKLKYFLTQPQIYMDYNLT